MRNLLFLTGAAGILRDEVLVIFFSVLTVSLYVSFFFKFRPSAFFLKRCAAHFSHEQPRAMCAFFGFGPNEMFPVLRHGMSSFDGDLPYTAILGSAPVDMFNLSHTDDRVLANMQTLKGPPSLGLKFNGMNMDLFGLPLNQKGLYNDEMQNTGSPLRLPILTPPPLPPPPPPPMTLKHTTMISLLPSSHMPSTGSKSKRKRKRKRKSERDSTGRKKKRRKKKGRTVRKTPLVYRRTKRKARSRKCKRVNIEYFVPDLSLRSSVDMTAFRRLSNLHNVATIDNIKYTAGSTSICAPEIDESISLIQDRIQNIPIEEMRCLVHANKRTTLIHARCPQTNKIVGALIYRIHKIGKFSEIMYIAVHKNHHLVHGIGSNLITLMKELMPADVCQIFVHADNRCIEFYLKNGFSRNITIEKRYTDNELDTCLVCKNSSIVSMECLRTHGGKFPTREDVRHHRMELYHLLRRRACFKKKRR